MAQRKSGKWVCGLVENAAGEMGGIYCVSQQGVPYVRMERDDLVFSVCFFAKTKVWRVFWPFPQRGQSKLEKADFWSWQAAKLFLDSGLWRDDYENICCCGHVPHERKLPDGNTKACDDPECSCWAFRPASVKVRKRRARANDKNLLFASRYSKPDGKMSSV